MIGHAMMQMALMTDVTRVMPAVQEKKVMEADKEAMRVEMQSDIDKVTGEKQEVERELQDLKYSMKDEIAEKERYISKIQEKELTIKVL